MCERTNVFCVPDRLLFIWSLNISRVGTLSVTKEKNLFLVLAVVLKAGPFITSKILSITIMNEVRIPFDCFSFMALTLSHV